ncbi:MAG TPA: VOC family protein [Frankiaceae bacterium]|jgi:predicted enzyme related to lactoylglutathione lyase|nr:VOC family protein [Frankiaceae bacterium]
MAVTSILAQSTVSDLDTAQRWYTTLWERGPDAQPMPGLLEWHLGETAGLQVWSEPERAGRSTVVIGSDDIDALAARLAAAGFEHEGPQPGGGSRILQLVDPDGNRVVMIGA